MIDQPLSCQGDNGIEIRALDHHAARAAGFERSHTAELRITKNDELIVREVFHDERKLHLRSMQLFEQLSAALPPLLPAIVASWWPILFA